jgi:hypothetical protein
MDQIRSETIGIVLAKPDGMNIFVKPILNRHQTRGTLKVVVTKSRSDATTQANAVCRYINCRTSQCSAVEASIGR